MVMLKDHTMGILHSSNLFWKMIVSTYEGPNVNYLLHFELDMDDEDIDQYPISLDEISHEFIAIPTRTVGTFSILEREWRELDHDFKFKYGCI